VNTIDLVYFNAGGGHRAAAAALDAVIREQSRPWRVRRVNLFEVLDPHDSFRKIAGMKPEDFYNARLARGWTLGLAQELKLLHAAIRLGQRAILRQLRMFWRRTKPDLVVSLVPNFNRAMCAALGSVAPDVPYVTVMTDFADYPPHFWIEPDLAQHIVCGTRKAVMQARSMGCDESRIHATSGMIIRPDFYCERPIDRRAEMLKLGLDPDRPTGIVMFGGHGSIAMRNIAAKLDDTQLILICGHNLALAKRLRSMSARAPRGIIGFTDDIRLYMQLSDFFIGKPGPGSISEAVQQRLPVIVVRNAWTMPQERYNTDWVHENEVGVVLESFRSIRTGVSEVTRRLAELRSNAARLSNRAVFEIPEILDHILNGYGKRLHDRHSWAPGRIRAIASGA
jgi:UDP-N-acetylglucosamine:LPS N-acetylglucosamine transferase